MPDKLYMKRTLSLFRLIIFSALFVITSCGSDNMTKSKQSTSSGLTSNGGNCACAATYSPVCGVNNITYDNSCIASCHNVTQTVQGNCICTYKPVCGDDGRTYTECDAQRAIRNGYIKSIVKFADCNAATY